MRNGKDHLIVHTKSKKVTMKPELKHPTRVISKLSTLAIVLAAGLGSAQAQSTVLWNVEGGSTWDTTATNWLDQGSATVTNFANGDTVIFDKAAGGSIAIAADVSPLSTTVNAPSGTYTFNDGPIATGSLTKDGGGQLTIQTNHNFNGGTTINGGTLRVNFPAQTSGLGSGPIVLNDGTFFLWRVTVDNSLTINGGNVVSSNGFGNNWNGPIILNAPFDCRTDFAITCNGTVSGAGGITKSGTSSMVLTGTNTYTGPTSVTTGTMKINTPDSLGSGDLSISAGGAKVNLDYTGTKVINALVLGGTQATNVGTYGSLTSDALFKSTYFEGPGTLTVGNLNSAAFIVDFGSNVAGSSAVFEPVENNAAAITWVIPSGTDPASLAPEFTLTAGSTCSDQTSGVMPSPNFGAGPVVYTVVSQDTTVTNVYTVTAVVLPDETTLVWNIAAGGNWDETTSNWAGQSSGLSTPFFEGVDVIFNKPEGGTILISPDISPVATTVSAPSGTYTFTGGPIASGSLTKDGGGTLRIEANSTFDGGTTINGGTLQWRFNTPDSSRTDQGLGTGPIVLNDGTFYLWRVNAANSLTINGGSVASWNGFGNNWNGTITLNTDFDCFARYRLVCNGVIDGTGGIAKSGQSNLTLAGTNTYTGSTSVTDGTLQIDTPDSLGAGDLIINGGVVNLNYDGTKIVNALTLGEAPATGSGTYGSTASGADFQNDTYFSGTGTVTFGDATTYDGWASRVFPSGLTLTDTTPSLDFDGGGLPTAVEWVVGGDPTDQSDDAGLAPTVSEDETYLIFTYLRTDVAANSNTIIAAEYGSDLEGWTDAQDQVDGVIITVTDGDPIDTVEVKIPKSLAGPGSKLFVRLNVQVAAAQ